MGYMGQAENASGMNYDPASMIITWAVGNNWPDPIVIRLGSQQLASGRSGSLSAASLIKAGQSYDFEMYAAEQLIKVLRVDATQGPASGYIVYSVDAAVGGTIGPDTSWFSGSTTIMGYAIPNLLLAGGGGLLFMAMMRRR